MVSYLKNYLGNLMVSYLVSYLENSMVSYLENSTVNLKAKLMEKQRGIVSLREQLKRLCDRLSNC